ncbi:MAG TPA: hypothetical protein VGH89_43110 [Pseudonocardia sp.]|jgi:hypothetical protein
MTDPQGPWGPLAEPMHSDQPIGPDDPPWRENAFFSLNDRNRRCYIIAHFQGGRTDAGMFARVSVLQDDHLTEVYEPMSEMVFASEHVNLDLSGRIQAKTAELELDLTLTPLRVPVDYSSSAALPGLRESEPLRHFEQAGRFAGSVTTKWGSLELNGTLIRDRTWGWRQDIASWTEYYASFFSFHDAGFDLAVMKFCTPDGDVPAHGALVGARTGEVVGSRIIRRNETGTIVEFEVTLADGNTMTLHLAKPEARIFCPLNDPQGPTALTAYDDLVQIRVANGPQAGAVGFGIMEQGILRRQA